MITAGKERKMRAARVIGTNTAVTGLAAASVDNADVHGHVVELQGLSSPFNDAGDALMVEEVAAGGTPVKKDEDTGAQCPICAEMMVSLLQLNRHLDDEHGFAEGEDSPTRRKKTLPIGDTCPQPSTPNEELSSWLRRGNEVKSKIQTALPRKFVNLDLFDTANNTFSMSNSDSSRTNSTSPAPMLRAPPEISVTRTHWKRPSGHDTCAYAGCKRQLNIKNGLVNCRRCGLLFCNAHTDYRIKLDEDAQYTHQGVWCRCCESCYRGKPGFDDYGAHRDLTGAFVAKRQQKVDDRDLYQNKLEKRLLNLASQINKIDREYNNRQFLQYSIQSRKRDVEQQLVQWEDGSHVLNCFICMTHFSFTLRRHHCRLCGRVVCGDLVRQCSMEIPIDSITTLLDVPRVKNKSLIRLCRDCKDVLFIRKNFQRDLKSPLTPLLQKVETQQNVKKAILVLMPRFQDMLKRLQSDQNKAKSLTQEASRLRKRLVDSFALFDKLTKEALALDKLSPDEQMLQLSVKIESASFIQENMAPLKQLPQLLQKLEEENNKSIPKPKYTREQVSLIKQHRETLMVLQEQKFLVEEMVENCKKQRKFDELPTLQLNLRELEQQINQLQSELGDEGF